MTLNMNTLPTEPRELSDADLELVAAGKRRAVADSGPQYNPSTGGTTTTRTAFARGLGSRIFVNRAI